MSAMGVAKVLVGGSMLVGFGVSLAGGDPRALFEPAWTTFTSFTGAASDNAPEIVEDGRVTARAFGDALRDGIAATAGTPTPFAPQQAEAPVTTLPTPVQP